MQDHHQILSYIESDRDLEVFYFFIMKPFAIPVIDRARRKLGNFTGVLKVEQKKTCLTNSKFVYIPEKHNMSLVRAQKMIYVFLKRSNIKVISQANPFYIDVFYKVANEQVFENERCRADMAHVFQMMQYFMALDPAASIRNIVRYHLCFELLGHLELSAAREMLTALITPGDNLFKIADKDRKLLTDYLVACQFGKTLVSCFSLFKMSTILGDKTQAASDPKIKALIKEMDRRFAKPSEDAKPKSLLLAYFHSFFGTRKVMAQELQPEEVYTSILDIDWLGGYSKPIRRSRLAKATTAGNMSDILDELDDENKENTVVAGAKSELLVQPSSSRVEVSEKEAQEGSQNPTLMELNDKIDDLNKVAKRKRNKKLLMKLRGIVRCVMCANLFMNKPQQMSKMKKDKGALHYLVYPETIQSSNSDIKSVQSNPKSYFERAVKLENKTSRMLDIISSCINGAIQQKNQQEFIKAIRLNVSEQDWVTPLFFSCERTVMELLRMFLLKMQFHLENKPLFPSGYWAGRLFVNICKELYAWVTPESFSSPNR